MSMKDFYSRELLATAKKPPFLPKGHRFHIPGEERLHEASQKVPALIDRDKLIEAIVNTPSLAAQEPTYDALSCMADRQNEILDLIENADEVDVSVMERSHNQLSRLRLKYGWHDCSKVLPNHSRHVVIWTNRGEYRAYYDHVHNCWRTTRDGLRITHWREQCGPENWPRAE